MWSSAGCREGKAAPQHVDCSFRNGPLASGARCIAWGAGKNNKTGITTKQHLHVTSSRKPKTHFECTHLFAHTPLHTRTLTHTHTDTHWHSDANSLCFTQAQTFVGPPRGRGRGGGGHPCCLLARMISCTLLHPVAAAGSGCSRVCRMHPANTGTRRFMHIGAVDTCVLVLLALQLLGCCCWWREWPMLR